MGQVQECIVINDFGVVFGKCKGSWAGSTRNSTVCNMQNALPLRRGSATNLPRESLMLEDDVIEHR